MRPLPDIADNLLHWKIPRNLLSKHFGDRSNSNIVKAVQQATSAPAIDTHMACARLIMAYPDTMVSLGELLNAVHSVDINSLVENKGMSSALILELRTLMQDCLKRELIQQTVLKHHLEGKFPAEDINTYCKAIDAEVEKLLLEQEK